MLTWHYRAVKRDGVFYVTEYYDDLEGSWVSDPVSAQGESKIDLIRDLQNMIDDIQANPVIKEKEIL